MANAKQTTNEITNNIETETKAPAVYTEQQIQESFVRGHKEGYITAIRQIRREISDYLISLEISFSLK